MKRILSLFVLAISLTAADPPRGCGTTPGTEVATRLRHQQNLRLARARKVRLAERTSAATTVGDLVVMDAGGGVVAQRNPFNLDRQVVRFTPQAGGGYRFVTEPGTVEELTQATAVTLGDDDSREFALPFPFPYFGQTKNRIFLNSDGNLTFDRADGQTADRSLGRFTAGPPRIAGLFYDLDPTSGGQVTMLTTPQRAVFTWNRVPDYRSSGVGLPNTFQVTLYPDGRIEIAYGGVNTLEAVVGLSRGDITRPTEIVSLAGGSSVTYTGSVAELFTLGDDLDLVTLSQRFYTQFDDAYDYLVVYNTMGLSAGSGVVAYEVTLRNSRTGYGDVPANSGSEYGSKQRLQAVLNMGPTSQFPLDPFGLVPSRGTAGDTPLSVLGHEAGHLFLAYASVRDANSDIARPMLGVQLAHWNFAFNSEASLLEGNRIRDNGPGASPRFETTATVEGYSPLDQYLMGLRAPEDVPATFLVTNPSYGGFNRGPQRGVQFDGVRRDVTIDEIVRAEGRRTPDHTVAQRHFRFAFIVLTSEGVQPTAEQLAQVERYRSEFAAYFARVTGGRATAETRLLKALRFRAEPALGVVEGATVSAPLDLDQPAAANLTLRLRSATGAVSVPETVTIAAGANSVLIPIRGVRAATDDITVETNAAGYEVGRLKVQVSPVSRALTVRVMEGARVLPRDGDPPTTVVARVVDQNYVVYPGLEVTATASDGGAVSPSRAVADAAGEVRFSWTPGQLLTLRVAGGDAGVAQAFRTPVVYDGGVINAAFREAGVQGLSPGGLTSLYGVDLATTTATSVGALTLEGTQVSVGTTAARLLYVSPTQINFVMPALAPGVYSIAVTTAAGRSALKQVALDSAWPGLFAARVNGGTLELDVTGLGTAGTGVRVLAGGTTLALASRVGTGPVVRLTVSLPAGLSGAQEVRVGVGERLSNAVTVLLP